MELEEWQHAGYGKFTRKMCPILSTGLNASRLDTPSLYITFCQHGKGRLCFFKYDRYLFRKLAEIYNHKQDVIWNSFFDMSRIQTVCERSKLCNHSRYTTFRITNEDYTSQTCVYCFEKLHHPKQSITKQEKATRKTIKSILICYNPKCSSIRNGHDTGSRDRLSALAIAI